MGGRKEVRGLELKRERKNTDRAAREGQLPSPGLPQEEKRRKYETTAREGGGVPRTITASSKITTSASQTGRQMQHMEKSSKLKGRRGL